jgi:hypothetical protein
MMECVESDGRVLALILRGRPVCEGATFYTPPENSIQLGILAHKQGTVIRPHIHKDASRTVRGVQEVLHVECGVIQADFYADDGTKLRSAKLSDGDTILFMNGGHGLKVLSDAKILEVKQGPYLGPNEDKTWLNPK